MSPESKRDQIEHSKPYDVSVGIPFKPFEKAEGFIKPDGEQPVPIPEEYDYIVLLQRKILYLGVEGYIDVISEDIETMGEIPVGGHSLEKPFGDVAFVLTISQSDTTAREIPYILRFSFIARSPSDYTKLLNSFVDINIGDCEYTLVWNINRPFVKENLKHLESGEEILVVEKNMFNRKKSEEGGDVGEAELEEFENKMYERIGFVWLPDDLDKLRTIELVFNQFEDGDDKEPQLEPDPSDKKAIPIPA